MYLPHRLLGHNKPINLSLSLFLSRSLGIPYSSFPIAIRHFLLYLKTKYIHPLFLFRIRSRLFNWRCNTGWHLNSKIETARSIFIFRLKFSFIFITHFSKVSESHRQYIAKMNSHWQLSFLTNYRHESIRGNPASTKVSPSPLPFHASVPRVSLVKEWFMRCHELPSLCPTTHSRSRAAKLSRNILSSKHHYTQQW